MDPSTEAAPSAEVQPAGEVGTSPPVDQTTDPQTEPTTVATDNPQAAFSFPGSDADEATRNDFNEQLRSHQGVPESAEDYEIPDLPDGWDEDTKNLILTSDHGIGGMMEKMHEAGAPPAVAKVAAEAQIGLLQGLQEQFSTGVKEQIARGDEALTAEFGDDASVTDALTKAGRAFSDAGVDLTAIFGEDTTLSTVNMPPEFKVAVVKMGMSVFEASRDATAPDGTVGGRPVTAADAERRLNDMRSDPDTRARLLKGDPTLKEERTRLMEVVNNG